MRKLTHRSERELTNTQWDRNDAREGWYCGGLCSGSMWFRGGQIVCGSFGEDSENVYCVRARLTEKKKRQANKVLEHLIFMCSGPA